METCSVCKRLHNQDMPCPRRIANAYTMQPQALEKLTEQDKDWMRARRSVVAIIEEAIAHIIEEEIAYHQRHK